MTPSPSNAVVAAEAEADDVEEIKSEEVVVEREGMGDKEVRRSV